MMWRAHAGDSYNTVGVHYCHNCTASPTAVPDCHNNSCAVIDTNPFNSKNSCVVSIPSLNRGFVSGGGTRWATDPQFVLPAHRRLFFKVCTHQVFEKLPHWVTPLFLCLCSSLPTLDSEWVDKIYKLMDEVDSYIPIPQRQTDFPFLMGVEDVFTITGRGTIAAGRVERASLSSKFSMLRTCIVRCKLVASID